MELKPPENPKESASGDRPVPVYVLPYADRDDEISLIDLWRVIATRKSLVLLSVLVAIGLTSAYAFLTEPLYRAEAHLLPPQQQAIQGLMVDYRGVGGAEVERYKPDLVYKAFQNNFKSRGLRREFFDTHSLAGYYLGDKSEADANFDAIFDTKFDNSLRLQAGKQDANYVVASFGDTDSEQAAQWLNQFIVFADQRTVQQLYEDVNAGIRAEIERIRDQLASKSKLATQRRHDKILILREALRVARALGIESAGSFVLPNKEKVAIEVNVAQAPLYMRGAKALEVEIEVLESRKSDVAFTDGLRDLQEELAFLEGIVVDRSGMSAVTIDSAARIPYHAEKPRKRLIFVLAIAFGLIVGIFLVFVAEFWGKMRVDRNNGQRRER